MSMTALAGTKLSGLIAGFLGALASLMFCENLSKWEKAITLFFGALSAGYVKPIVTSFFNIAPTSPLDDSVAFFVGFSCMNILSGIYKLTLAFKKDPTQFGENLFNLFRGKK